MRKTFLLLLISMAVLSSCVDSNYIKKEPDSNIKKVDTRIDAVETIDDIDSDVDVALVDLCYEIATDGRHKALRDKTNGRRYNDNPPRVLVTNRLAQNNYASISFQEAVDCYKTGYDIAYHDSGGYLELSK